MNKLNFIKADKPDCSNATDSGKITVTVREFITTTRLLKKSQQHYGTSLNGLTVSSDSIMITRSKTIASMLSL